MSITIERAKPADAAMLLAFLKQVGGETDNLSFGGEGLPFTVEAEAEFLGQMERSADGIMLVAKENGVIIGNASLNRMPRRMSHRGDFSVAVAKSHWNMGIGGQLLSEIILFAEENGFDVIELQVRSDHLGAIHLYEKFGFQKIGTHTAFFKIEDRDISFDYMVLRLK